MNLTLCSAVGLSLILVSCTSLDPEYAAYKKQKEAEAAAGAQAPFGQGTDPYGVPGTPTGGGETGSYAPLQPLPGVYDPNPAPASIPPLGNPTPGAAFPSIPNTPAPALGGATTPHVVVKGDSLWGLARRYNTTADAIRAANGIPAASSNIQMGQTLQIPQN